MTLMHIFFLTFRWTFYFITITYLDASCSKIAEKYKTCPSKSHLLLCPYRPYIPLTSNEHDHSIYQNSKLLASLMYVVVHLFFFLACPWQKPSILYVHTALLRQGTREITRLDLTMQPLIQDILSQIIDSSPCCPERFRDFSCMRFPFKTKQKVLSHVNSFWSDIYKKCQKWF